MHIPNASLRTIQHLPEQLPPETQAYVLVQSGVAAARRFEREYGERLLDHLRAGRHHAHSGPVRSALVQLRERHILGSDDPLPRIADGLRRCPEDEADLHEAAEAMMTAVAAARDALAAWRALRGVGNG